MLSRIMKFSQFGWLLGHGPKITFSQKTEFSEFGICNGLARGLLYI